MNYKDKDLNDFIKFEYLDDIAPNKSKLWMQVEAVLGLLYKTHPIEMIEYEKAAEQMRSLNTTKGSSGLIPARFMRWFDLIYREDGSLPYSSKAEFFRDFFKHYPQFSYKK